jgi:hypothetical protein
VAPARNQKERKKAGKILSPQVADGEGLSARVCLCDCPEHLLALEVLGWGWRTAFRER